MKKIASIVLAMLTCLSAWAVDAASGYCGANDGNAGKNVQWNYDSSTHTLTFTGEGEMGSWSTLIGPDWCEADFASDIEIVEVGEGITNLGRMALYNLVEVISVSLPSTLESIDGSAFYGCRSLTSIHIPASVTRIWQCAFQNLTQLRVVTGCAGLKQIDESVFAGTGIRSFPFPATLETIGSNAFEGCPLTTVTLGDNVTTIQNEAFKNCTSLKNVTLGKSVYYVYYDAFVGCTALERFTSLNPEPPNYFIGFGAYSPFDFEDNTKVPLFVPDAAAVKAYKESRWADDFANIYPLNAERYTLTISAGKGGTVNEEVNGEYYEGTEVTIEAYPDERYKFVEWSDHNTEASRVITIDKDITLTAQFEALPLPEYTVTVTAGNGGKIAVGNSGLRTTFSASVQEGTQLQIRAVADEGYYFLQWSDGNTDEKRTITVTDDLTLSAVFAVVYYSFERYAGEGGKVGGSAIGSYAYGTELTVFASAFDDYVFVEWQDGNGNFVSSDWYYTFTLTSDLTLVAVFRAVQYYIVDVASSNASQGTVTISGGTTNSEGKYKEGSEITITAIPTDEYKFSSWDDGNTDNPRVITVNANISLLALFKERMYYTLYVGNTIGGTVTEGENGTYEEDTEVLLRVSSGNGYSFYRWSDGNMDNPRHLILKENTILYPIFVEQNCNK